jgi:hypothetical protein
VRKRSIKKRKDHKRFCLFCKKEFFVETYRKDTVKFCSVKCTGGYKSTKPRKIRKIHKRICAFCKKEFFVEAYRKNISKFCSRLCMNEYKRTNNWRYPVPLNEAIGVERVVKKDRIQNVYIFKCTNKLCNNELRIWGKGHKNHMGLCLGCWHKKRPYEHMYNKLVTAFYGNRRKNSMTYEEYLTFVGKRCAYCDSSISWAEYASRGAKHRISSGYYLDRKNSKEGYSVANCVPCCTTCNRAKNNLFSYEEFLLFSPVLKEIIRLRNKNKEPSCSIH